MNNKKRLYLINTVFSIMLITMVVVFIKMPTTPHSQADQVKEVHEHTSSEKRVQGYSDDDVQQLDHTQEDTPKDITYDDIVALTDQFMDTLVQEIDDDYKVIHFDHIDDLADELAAISTHEIAQTFIEYYYEEEHDGLYIIPTETPPWFMANHPYDVVQLKQDKVQITQTNETDFYGTYTIELELTYQDGWKITKITH